MPLFIDCCILIEGMVAWFRVPKSPSASDISQDGLLPLPEPKCTSTVHSGTPLDCNSGPQPHHQGSPAQACKGTPPHLYSHSPSQLPKANRHTQVYLGDVLPKVTPSGVGEVAASPNSLKQMEIIKNNKNRRQRNMLQTKEQDTTSER